MKLSQMAAEAAANYEYDIIMAKVNGKLTEISDREIQDEKVEFITVGDSIGNETYKRSVLLLMLNAIHKIDKEKKIKKVTVEFSLSKGLYCEIKGDFTITEEFLAEVKRVMLEDVKANIPIKKAGMKTSEAIKLFEEHGMSDKTRLFKYRISSYVNVYSIEDYSDYFYGYMASHTGILGVFDLFKYDKGFVLQLPIKESPKTVPEFAPQAKLFNVLEETSEWADMLGVDTVASLNEHIISGDINSLILVQEALQEQKIVDIVNKIKKRDGIKFIMIAGPSSSGKTTFSHRLSIQLRASGFKPHAIGVDNYFVEREQTPVDENGNYIGGAILPGAGVSMNSLSSRTAQLPRISFDAPKGPVGKNTVDCMKSGLIYGHAGSIDGIIDRIIDCCGFGKNGKPAAKLVATGGLSKVIIPFCRNRIETDPALLIRGLKYIYDKNV